MSIQVEIDTRMMSHACAFRQGHRPYVTVETETFRSESPGQSLILCVEALIWCRDAEEAEGIAEVINKATERQASRSGVEEAA